MFLTISLTTAERPIETTNCALIIAHALDGMNTVINKDNSKCCCRAVIKKQQEDPEIEFL